MVLKGSNMRLTLVLITLAATFEIPLLVLPRLFPQLGTRLPLGGDELTQLGILVLTGLFLGQLIELVPQLIRLIISRFV